MRMRVERIKTKRETEILHNLCCLTSLALLVFFVKRAHPQEARQHFLRAAFEDVDTSSGVPDA